MSRPTGMPAAATVLTTSAMASRNCSLAFSGRALLASGEQCTLCIGGQNVGLRQAKFAADDVGATRQRDHLIERVQTAHALSAEAAVGGYDQPLRPDHL